MLPKTESHAKWILITMVMMAILLWFGQQRQIRTAPNDIQAQADAGIVLMASKVSVPSEIPVSTQVKSASANIQSTRNYKLFPHQGQDLSRYSAIEVTATGYYAGKESTGKTPGHPEYGVTFSGLKVTRDAEALSTIAADPKIFPIGTVLYVPGYGYGVVADTGSAIKGKRIDLYFETKDQVYKEWGKKKLNVFIVKKGDGKINEPLWNQLKSELLF